MTQKKLDIAEARASLRRDIFYRYVPLFAIIWGAIAAFSWMSWGDALINFLLVMVVFGVSYVFIPLTYAENKMREREESAARLSDAETDLAGVALRVHAEARRRGVSQRDLVLWFDAADDLGATVQPEGTSTDGSLVVIEHMGYTFDVVVPEEFPSEELATIELSAHTCCAKPSSQPAPDSAKPSSQSVPSSAKQSTTSVSMSDEVNGLGFGRVPGLGL